MAQHNELGKYGEELAAQHLLKKGYQILRRNWHAGHDEIDIIAKDGDWLVIVEVKTRTSEYAGEPETAVTKTKQKSLVRAAEAFIHEIDHPGETRFDVIGILIEKGEYELNHIEDAFVPRM